MRKPEEHNRISRQMKTEMKRHLEEKLLPFWKGLIDRENGGYFGYVDGQLQIHKEAVKGCILNSRILWFFSNAYLCLKDRELEEYAAWAYVFLRDYFYDREKGGLFWSVTCEGRVEDDGKHTYNQAFGVYALAAYYRAFGEEEALLLAGKLVQVIEEKCFDRYGYKEAQTRDFGPADNEKLSENGVLADRTMNTLLHVLEAYTEYYRITRDLAVGEKLRYMLGLIEGKIYNSKLRRQEVFFDNEMHSLIDLHSYGHDIETAWLVDRCVEILGDADWAGKMSPVTAALEDQVYKEAYRSHSLANECEKGVVDERRIWWVQAEGVTGFYNAWQKTKEGRYLEASADVWGFIREHIVDKRPGGEWFWYTDEAGRPAVEAPEVEPWKCPYHNGRMCMEIMMRGEGSDAP